MAGTVYLRTNRFEVKLEGITFKTKDFESLCEMDFLFPEGKVWARPPIVGLDVMRHPRDPSILLLLLCFGVGCVILRFGAGEFLPAPINRFLADKRIHFVGFGIPEKKELFPFDDLGLSGGKMDIGYLAAKILEDTKYKKWELAELARKVLGIKKMIGLTDSSSFERHEQIKCAICQLFITSVIGMGLLDADDKKKTEKTISFKKNSSFLKNLNSLHLLAEGWFKLPMGVGRKKKQVAARDGNLEIRENDLLNAKYKEDYFVDYFLNAEIPEGDSGDDSKGDDSTGSKGDLGILREDYRDEGSFPTKKPLKGILKCPSRSLQRSYSTPCPRNTSSPPSTPRDQMGASLKRANSKGFNVSFKCH